MTEYVPSDEYPHPAGGTQRLYGLPNGLSASAICTPGSYGGAQGLWELYVERPTGKHVYIEGLNQPNDGAIGWLTDDGLNAALDQFAALRA
jgi:hypothetical protein